MTQTVDPAIEWLEQQAAVYAAALDDPALRAQVSPIPGYLANPHTQPLPVVDDTPTLRERLQAGLDEHTIDGAACRDHYDGEGEPVPYPCDIVTGIRAALGMPALEGAEPRG